MLQLPAATKIPPAMPPCCHNHRIRTRPGTRLISPPSQIDDFQLITNDKRYPSLFRRALRILHIKSQAWISGRYWQAGDEKTHSVHAIVVWMKALFLTHEHFFEAFRLDQPKDPIPIQRAQSALCTVPSSKMTHPLFCDGAQTIAIASGSIC